MDLLRLLAEPRKLFGGATVVLAVLAGLWAFGQSEGRITTGMYLLLPVVVLSVVAWKVESAVKGWLYLFVGWALGIVAYGALFPMGL